MKKSTKIIWGVALILVGVIVALNRLDILTVNLFFDGWWTLFIILPCAFGLFRRENVTGNFIGIVIGAALFLLQQEWVNFDLIRKLFLPVLLVAIGVGVIFSNKEKSEIEDEIEEIENRQSDGIEMNDSVSRESKILNGFAAFSGVKFAANGEEVEGGELTAVFGGVDYDLRNAVFKEKTVLNVSAIFGGVDIVFPENVIVKIKPTSIFGGTSDKRTVLNAKAGDGAPVVYVNALSMFGGVKIK